MTQGKGFGLFFGVCIGCIILALVGIVCSSMADAQTSTTIKRVVVEGDTLTINLLGKFKQRANHPSVPTSGWAYVYQRDSSLYLIIPDGRIFRMTGTSGGGGGTPFYAKYGAGQVTDSLRFADGGGITWTLAGNTFTAKADSGSWIPTDADVAARVPKTTTLTAGWGITGGGDLSANRTIGVDTGVGKVATKTELALKAALTHTHAAGDVTSGTFSVPRGGTGQATLTAHAVLVGNGAGSVLTFLPGTTGQMVYSDGTDFQNGSPGGDLTGSYPSPSIAANAVTSSKILNGTILPADMDTSASGMATASDVWHYSGVGTFPSNDTITVTLPGITSSWGGVANWYGKPSGLVVYGVKCFSGYCLVTGSASPLEGIQVWYHLEPPNP